MTPIEMDSQLQQDTEHFKESLGNQFECQALQRTYEADFERYIDLPPRSPARASLLATLNALRARLRSLNCGIPNPS